MGQLTTLAGEAVLVVTALILLLFGVFSPRRGKIIAFISMVALLVFGFVGYVTGTNGTAFNGAFVADDFSVYVKALLGLAAAASLWLSRDYFVREGLDKFEYSILMLFAVAGMGLMVSANNLLTLYVGVEMQSLALYVMAAFNRDSLRASEAGLKYFVLGALSSGLLLYGMSMIYGFTGAIAFSGIEAAISADGVGAGLITGLVFMLSGLAFKISAAPFHMWTPDVYEGAPTPVTGFFAAAPKLAAIALIARVVTEPFGEAVQSWQQVLIALAVLSMFIGAIGALVQNNIKRLMAYSSIANMGYALVALSAASAAGISGMLLFMTIYLLTTIGVFACILQMRTHSGMVEQVSDLAGLSKSNMPLAVSFTVLMLSLAGIPPLLGFFGKWFAFAPAFGAGLTWLVVAALIASVIGAFYYLRIVKTVWFDDGSAEFESAPRALAVLAGIPTVLITLMWVLPFLWAPLRTLIDTAAAGLF